MRQEIVDLAEVQFAKKIQAGSERCIIHALSSPLARARGWSSQGSEAPIDDQPRHTILQLEILPPTGRSFDYSTGQIIEHRAIEDGGAEDSLVVEDTRTVDDL